MEVRITVGGEEGFVKRFNGDYFTLECNDWNEIMQELLDYQQDLEEGNVKD